MPRISIALATYNGERYIRELFDSLISQVALPDEVVVSDDSSTDRTVEIIEEMAGHAPFKVIIVKSKVRGGVIENFHRAFSHCSCELIAYCDQDDIWHPGKVEACVKLIEETGAALLIHRSRVVDANLSDTGVSLPEIKGSRLIKHPYFIHSVCGFGHQMVFRRELLAYMNDFTLSQNNGLKELSGCFDYLIPAVAGMIGDVYYLDEDLVKFRRHSNSTSPAGKIQNRSGLYEKLAYKRNEIKRHIFFLEGLNGHLLTRGSLEYIDGQYMNAYMNYLCKLIEGYKRRLIIYENDKSFLIRAVSLLNNIRYGLYGKKVQGMFGIKAMVLDGIALAHKPVID